MSTRIIDRGRGPEIEGTRITVYSIMDYLPHGTPPAQIAADLRLCTEQVQAALDYIAAHRTEVEAEYGKIMERIRNGKNPEWFEAGRAKSPEELKARLSAQLSLVPSTHA